MTSAIDQMTLALTRSKPAKGAKAGNVHSRLLRIACPVGARYGMLTVLEEGPRYFPDAKGYRGRRWRCACDCGVVRDISMANIRRGWSKSCGCQQGMGSRFSNTRQPKRPHPTNGR